MSNRLTKPDSREPGSRSDSRIVWIISLALLAGSFIFFLMRTKAGLYLIDFGDESSKFVAAQMLNKGLSGYKEVIGQHGPFVVILCHLYAMFISSTDFFFARLIMIFTAIGAGAALILSPVVKNYKTAIWTAAIFLPVLSSVWALQAVHMVMYQTIGAFLLLIAFSQIFLPALLHQPLNRYGLYFSGFAITAACFSSYSFGPAAVFFTAGTLMALLASGSDIKKYLISFAAGVFSATLINAVWLIISADFKGFLIHHLYFNQKFYAEFIQFSPLAIFYGFRFSFSPEKIIHSMAVIFFFIWLSGITYLTLKSSNSRKEIILKAASLLALAAGVAFLNPRGSADFQGAGFVVMNIGAFALITALFFQRRLKTLSGSGISRKLFQPLASIILIFVIAETAADNALSTPHRDKRESLKQRIFMPEPQNTGIGALVRSLTDEEDKVLAMPFYPDMYIWSNRLPASSCFAYFPWYALYSRDPVAGYEVDICEDITRNKPKFIFYSRSKVWFAYSMDDYEPCVPEIINQNYFFLGRNLYVRNDIAEKRIITEPEDGYKGRLTPRLTRSRAIKLSMSDTKPGHEQNLKRIAVMLRIDSERKSGRAELRLEGPDKSFFSTPFSLEDLAVRGYYYFEVDPGIYTSGEIISLSGAGVRAMESLSEQGDIQTCIIYEYENEQIRFTPGCPVY